MEGFEQCLMIKLATQVILVRSIFIIQLEIDLNILNWIISVEVRVLRPGSRHLLYFIRYPGAPRSSGWSSRVLLCFCYAGARLELAATTRIQVSDNFCTTTRQRGNATEKLDLLPTQWFSQESNVVGLQVNTGLSAKRRTGIRTHAPVPCTVQLACALSIMCAVQPTTLTVLQPYSYCTMSCTS